MRNKFAIVLSVLLFIIMITFIQLGAYPQGIIPINTGATGITQSLFTTYLLPFEIVTFLLVAAMLGAMYLGERGENK
ncbi:MAG: hypothetical protein M0Z77_09320 [Thermoplasmatales archaeon]|nr:hypothetical protein [Candidatus Thermoplasmatota archaeon]MDA8055826.1 hypothetical protein [Thermoplasmatales archaeon]